MEIEEHTEITPREWGAAVEASDDTWLFHTAGWIEATASVWPLENRYFVARRNNRIVGGFPLQVAPGGRRPWVRPRAYSTRMGTGGPFAARDLAPKGRRRVLAALSDAVLQFGRKRRLAAIDCILPPLAANNLRNIRGVNPMVLLGWEDSSTHTRIIDLTRPESELVSALRVARRNMNRAKAEGYTVERADWKNSLDDYYQVHVETYRRTGVPPHPKVYFEAIAEKFGSTGQAVLWVCRAPTGEPVAYHNCARFGEGAVYWTGCSRTGHGEAGANYLLCWRAILGAQQDGYRFYDVGESFPNTSDRKLQGLSEFKSKFGGELFRLFRGRLPLKRCRGAG